MRKNFRITLAWLFEIPEAFDIQLLYPTVIIQLLYHSCHQECLFIYLFKLQNYLFVVGVDDDDLGLLYIYIFIYWICTAAYLIFMWFWAIHTIKTNIKQDNLSIKTVKIILKTIITKRQGRIQLNVYQCHPFILRSDSKIKFWGPSRRPTGLWPTSSWGEQCS